MCKNTELNLGVVSAKQHFACGGDEGLAQCPSNLCPYGNVLQVGVTGAQPTCCSHCLVKRCVDTAICADLLRQGIRIRTLELGQLTVRQDTRNDRIVWRQLLKDIGVCRKPGLRLLTTGHTHFFKQDVLKLLWTRDAEFLTGKRMDFALELADTNPHDRGLTLHFIFIKADAHAFHVSEDGRKWQLHGLH